MAAIDPIRFSTMENITRLAAMISQEVNLLLVDRGSLRNTPFLSYQGSINGSGSDTVRVRLAGLDGRDSFQAAGSEISDESANSQALTVLNADIVCARQFLIYNISDLASMSSFGPSDIDPFRLAESIAMSYDTRFSELTSVAASAFGTSKGSNGTTLTVDTVMSAMYELEKADSNRGVPGPYALVLAPKALTEFQDSLRDETGNAISRMQTTADMLKVKGENYSGEIFGMSVYRSAHINENGSSGYDNYVIGRSALGFADGIPNGLPGAADFMQKGKVLIEFERTAQSAKTSVVGHCYLGIGIIDDNRGCKILSAR